MKYILILILLVFVSCNKQTPQIENITTEQTETTQLTEKECWVLFDEFWVDFQKSVVKGDTVKLKEMCEFNNEYNTIEGFYNKIKHPILEKGIKKVNKENKYSWKSNQSYIDISYSDNIFFLFMSYFEKKKNMIGKTDEWCMDFTLKDGKYKLVKYR